ncbi:PREDICTED: WD repeat-containing protein WRAP73-like isoform X3 [Wasmannia auropunctata]|uniref:WD repeat-containing protein WRAP73-like isoform X1 n=1 Tax=Wasmannia auropunctata TaxID=64793 RepID=UPI0005EE939F|nr:PREDICTED: WD repeat-containing protein WRAP73-like isoform X1 [Wasmannia auropunctata]XP_011695855.1 PREDICTED: WD repeat-containing protein WRAP73-like isoform X2 [Wasmannia auropunctata]XP_011695856.1 PREDICTED: WD repeat-containing protein WRAP73-like isoform X3 [Wasmannia auropunctata]
MTANADEDKLFRINNRLCHFSRNGAYLAVAFQANLLIKDARTLDTRQSFVFVDVIQCMEWSLNSEYILCANIKRSVIQIYSIRYPQWKCKLTEGSAGLQDVTWAPDSKHILVVADFHIQISVWNLEEQSVSYIQNVKSSSFDQLRFSPNGKRLAVIVTEEGQDRVEIYKTENWRISRKLICERLRGIDGIRWSPNDELLCIWCSSPAEPKLIIYSNALEKHVTAFSPLETAQPSTACNHGKELRGIENVEWIPSGQLLAVIGFNEVVVLLNYITWQPLSKLYLDPVIRECNYLTKVYKECADSEKASNKRFASCEERVLREIHERPICIEIGRKDDNDNFSIAKMKLCEFSTCGQYLALKHELYPTTLWIWDICTDYLDYLLLENPITAVKWSPVRPQLFVLSECTRVYEWTRKGARSVPMSKNMSVVDAYWHPVGEKVALCGYNKAMIYEITNSNLNK